MARNSAGQLVVLPDDASAVEGEVADIIAGVREDQEQLGERMAEDLEPKLSEIYREAMNCPVCKSDDIHAEESNPESDYIYQKCSCGSCGSTWTEEYKFRAIYNIELGDNQ